MLITHTGNGKVYLPPPVDLEVDPGAAVEVPADIAGTPPTADTPGTGLLADPAMWAPTQAAPTDEAAATTRKD